MSMGNKKFVAYDITHDGTATTIDASSIELHYIDHAVAGQANQGTNVTTNTGELTASYGAYITMTALSTTAITSIWAIGW
jgi:hypothetical protein